MYNQMDNWMDNLMDNRIDNWMDNLMEKTGWKIRLGKKSERKKRNKDD